MTPNDVTKMLAVLKSVYPHHPISDAAHEAWNMTMQDVPYDAAMPVIKQWMLTEEWFPTPAAIRKQVYQVLSPLPSASDAWLMVMDRIRNTYPGFQAPDWDAPKIVQDALKDIGGTWAVRQTDDTSRMEQKFRSAYNERRDSATRGTLLASGMRELEAGV